MNIKKTIAWTGLIAATMGISPIAFAQDAGLYAGAAVGQTRTRDVCMIGVPLACDDTDIGWKIFGGYQFNKYFGAELGYVNLGKATASGTIPGGTVNANFKSQGLDLVGVGTVPLTGNFSAYGKLGFFRWEVDTTFVTTGARPAFFTENGTDVTFGIGVKYDFAKSIGVRLEWQRYKDLGKVASTGNSDVDLFSVGVVYKF